MSKRENITRINFNNPNNSVSYFDIVRLEELLTRPLDHNIYNNHIVKFYVMIFITEAIEGCHGIDFKDYNYKAGTILLIRKDQIHQFYKNTTVKGYLLVFTEEFIVTHLSKPEALNTLQVFNEVLNDPIIQLDTHSNSFLSFIELISELKKEFSQIDDYALRIMRSTLHIIIIKLLRLKSSEQVLSEKKYLREFLTFSDLVEKNCFSTKKVIDYADLMGVSTKTLNNIVQSITHKTAKMYISDISILQIKRQLICTSKSIKEIAYSTGFEDPTNFCKYFKKNTGFTPELFRNQHR